MTNQSHASLLFRHTTTQPVWEGVVFPGLDLNNPHAKVFDAPVPDLLKPYIQSIWYMTWDLPAGTEYHGIGVPIPCIKISATHIENYRSDCHFLGPKNKGVMLKFAGSGQGLGMDFKPGGFYPFLGQAMDAFENQFLSIEDVLPDFPAMPEIPWTLNSAEEWYKNIVMYFESGLSMLRSHHLGEITQVIETILSTREKIEVDELLEKLSVSRRTLQRVFQAEVGLSLKDVLRVTRFHQTIQAMNGAKIQSFAQFALESGYFDQPHMANDFKKLISASPKIFKKYW